MEQCVTVTKAKSLGGYRLQLTFSDGSRGLVDLRDRIVGRGGMYRALEDTRFFRRGRVDPEAGSLVWPNGLDICPDLLHSLALGQPDAAPTPAAR